MNTRLFRFLIFIVACLTFLPGVASAEASFSIAPKTGTYKTGELFSVLINLDTGGKNINAGTAEVQYDKSRLEIKDVGFSRSTFTLWTEEPRFSNSSGILKFSGGVPSPGFKGSSGAIVRVTFRTKAPGEASVAFLTGSILENDGKGTNIAEALRGASYTITGEAKAEVPTSTGTDFPSGDFENSGQAVPAPLVTEVPKQIQEGDVIALKGLGLPNAKVQLYVQKGNDEPVLREVIAGPDGKFSFAYDSKALTGFYRIWARNMTAEGILSDSSEPVMIEVIKPFFFRIGSLVLSYTSVVITLISLLVFLAILIVWTWRKMRMWQIRRGKEISEAEEALHEGFDDLQAGLSDYVAYLKKGRTPGSIKKREAKVRENLKKGIEGIERKIEKEIEDIE